MVRGWGVPRPQSRYSLLCLWTALGGSAATAKGQSGARAAVPPPGRPGGGRVPADSTSSCGRGRQGSFRPFALFLQHLHAQAPKSCCFPPDPTVLQGENCAVVLAEAKGTWGLRAFTRTRP